MRTCYSVGMSEHASSDTSPDPSSQRQAYEALRRELHAMRLERDSLRDRLAGAEQALAALRAENEEYVGAHGVLWKIGADGVAERVVYCPHCLLVMTPLPSSAPEYLMCTACRRRADFRPDELEQLARAVAEAPPA